jgi:hypothetical protein
VAVTASERQIATGLSIMESIREEARPRGVRRERRVLLLSRGKEERSEYG